MKRGTPRATEHSEVEEEAPQKASKDCVSTKHVVNGVCHRNRKQLE